MGDNGLSTAPATDSRKRRLPWLARVGIVVAIVGGGAIANESVNDELDTAETERQILSWAKDQDVAAKRVSCPSSIEVEAGRTFHCILYTRNAGDLRVEVSVENDDGEITWQVG